MLSSIIASLHCLLQQFTIPSKLNQQATIIYIVLEGVYLTQQCIIPRSLRTRQLLGSNINSLSAAAIANLPSSPQTEYVKMNKSKANHPLHIERERSLLVPKILRPQQWNIRNPEVVKFTKRSSQHLSRCWLRSTFPMNPLQQNLYQSFEFKECLVQFIGTYKQIGESNPYNVSVCSNIKTQK